MKWYGYVILGEFVLLVIALALLFKPKQVEVVQVTDTIYHPQLVYEYRDSIHLVDHYINTDTYHEITGRTDTFYLTKTDTVTIVRDWETTRKYVTELFDIKDFGKCSVEMELEFNRVNNISYNLTQYKSKDFHAILGATITTKGFYAATAGVEYKHIVGLLHAGYEDGFACGISAMYKF